jgi:predicted metal-dependent hydrolase
MTEAMMQQSVRYGTEEISYQVRFLASKSGKIAIHIHPNGSVQVDAPAGSELRDVKQVVQKRARWLTQHLTRIREQQSEVLPRRYISGESHFYLGRRYSLKVLDSDGAKPAVKMFRGQLQIDTLDRSAETIKGLLWSWYLSHAREVFQRRTAALAPGIIWLKGYIPPIKLLTMKKQWGSCSPKGNILLNPHLVKAPRECIDYVILHEICHLQEHNHSPEFYRLLSQLMPDWKTIKARLDGMAEVLLNS